MPIMLQMTNVIIRLKRGEIGLSVLTNKHVWCIINKKILYILKTGYNAKGQRRAAYN